MENTNNYLLMKPNSIIGQIPQIDIDELSDAFEQPSPDILKILCTVMIFLDKEENWPTIRRELHDKNFLSKLKMITYDSVLQR